LSSILIFLLLPLPAEDYFNHRTFDEAFRYYRLVLATAPSYEAYYGAAICALANGKAETCIELFKRVPRKKSKMNYYLGVAHYQLGFYEKAVGYFDESMRKDNKLWQSYYYLGLMKLKQKNVEEAIGYFGLAPESDYKTLLVDYVDNYNRLVEAQNKFREGHYHNAIDVYENVENFFGYRETGLALSFAKIGEYSKSLALFDSVINHSSNKRVIGRSMFEAAKICVALKKYLKARAYLKKYLEILTSDDALFLLGNIFSNEAKYDSAALYFGMLPDSVDEYLFYKGRTDFFLGLWGQAERNLLQHREISPNSIHGDRTIYILASINFKRKEYNDAIDFWNELISRYPHSIYAASALKGIGDAYFNIKDYKNALNAYRRIQEYKPSSSIEEETTLKIYVTLYHLKIYSSLINALRRFVKKNPNSKLVPKTRLRIAKMSYDKKHYYRSLSELNQLIEDYPNSPVLNEALVERARVCRKINNVIEVKNSFHYLLKNRDAKEYYSYAANELGSIYLEESHYDSALYYYNLLLDFDKYREKAMLEVAKIYDILGQHEAAETMIDKLISDFPASVFLFDAYMVKSKAHKNQGNYQKAIDVLKDLMEKIGEKPEIYIEIGNTYFEIEDYTNARANYLLAGESFRQKRDDAAQALILAGDASIALGDKKSAVEYYLQANLIAKSLTLKNQATEKMSTIIEE